jgi:MscS family membrane protein
MLPCLAIGSSAAALQAQSLSSSMPPLPAPLIVLANLDQRIGTARSGQRKERLTRQRHEALAQLIRQALSTGAQDLAPVVSTLELERLQAAAKRAQASGDQLAEMTALLQLNAGILDQAFANLLDGIATAWSEFAAPSAFDEAFSTFRSRTTFDIAPFANTVAGFGPSESANVNASALALKSAYQGYEQRHGVYQDVVQALNQAVAGAVSENRLLGWLGIRGMIDAINAPTWVAAVNNALFASGRMNLGQIAAAVTVFVVVASAGLLLIALTMRMLARRRAPAARSTDAESKDERAARKGQRFGNLLRLSFETPLKLLVLLAAADIGSRVLFLGESDQRVLAALSTLAVIVIVWALLRLINNLVMLYSKDLLQRYPTLRAELVNFISNAIRITVVIVAILYLLRRFGYDISTLLASLGIGGLAVAFAAKETIANIFGCVSIIADDMFRQGDWIVTPSGEGTVIDIGLRSTRLRTFDNAVIFVPNGYLAGVEVRNWSRRKIGRRIKFSLGLEYGSPMPKVLKTVDDIRAMLLAHAGIADSSTDASRFSTQQLTKIANAMDEHGVKTTLLVYLDSLGDSSINILVYCFSKTIVWQEWLEVQQDVLARCCGIAEANGLNIAFPSQTLYLRDDNPQPTGEPRVPNAPVGLSSAG